MPKLVILHLSDLHLDNQKIVDQRIVIKALLADLDQLKKRSIIPNLVIFSGDLINKGNEPGIFDLAKKDFIDPVISSLGLSTENFLIVPGNHDLDIKKIDAVIDTGLTHTMISNETVNAYLDDVQNKEIHFAALHQFYNFRKALNNKPVFPPENHAHLLTAHSINIAGKKVGVACLNSAWRASGKPNNHDYGKLIIGERQVDWAIESLHHTDVKILVAHHPLEWLTQADQQAIRRRILENFQFVLFGHNHHADAAMVINPTRRCITINSGALYQNRNYFNGFNVIEYEFNEKATIYVRGYYDQRRQFDEAVNVAERGTLTFSDLNFDNSKEPPSQVIPAEFEGTVIEFSNRRLLSALASTSAPKTLKEIFVEPRLGEYPEEEEESKKEATGGGKLKSVSLRTLFTGDRQNLLVVGKRESGKTTLLNYFSTEFLAITAGESIVPFYVHLPDVREKRNGVEKAMHDFGAGAWSNKDLSKMLDDGCCLIMFDDVSFDDQIRIEILQAFTKKYPKNRFLFTADEDLYRTLHDKKPPDLGVDYNRIYIHSFRRKQTRELVVKWFGENTNVDTVVETTLQYIRKINIPQSPLLISMILWILETQRTFSPRNHASLVEWFVQGVLEKLSDPHRLSDDMDYRNKEHYLSHIAHYMASTGRYSLQKIELERETLQYFESKGITTSIAPFIEYFLSKGIFIELNKEVCFKFGRCYILHTHS